MTRKFKIFKNSFLLMSQPFLMNVISLFIVGYIARKIGTSDFGIFNFVTAFTMLFYPLAVMGLNRVMVRDMAGVEDMESYAGKMVPLRIVTIFLAVAAIILIAHILGYQERTTYAMYLACSIFAFQLLLETFTDIFNACERMEFTALAKLIAGLTLTILSVVVLYLGFGLYELIGVYAFGQMIGFFLALFLLKKFFFRPKLKIDWPFSKRKIREGVPFFLMTIMWYAMIKLDIVFLSKKVSMAELGIYTSAILLVTKLSIIPQGISSSLLPSVSDLYSKGKSQDISDLTNTFLTKIILLILPGVILVSFFSYEVIEIIFGEMYHDGGGILRIGIWSFLINCISFVEFSVLTAMHKQKKLMISYAVCTVYCVISNYTLISHYGPVGAVAALLSTQLFLAVLFTYFTLKTVQNIFHASELFKIALLNGVLVIILVFLKPYNFIWVSFLVMLFYILGSQYLNLLRIRDILKLKGAFKIT